MKKLITGLLVLSPFTLLAQAYQLNLQGTRQIGMGSTGLAYPTDATSLFTNPGSAAFSGGSNVTFGITPAVSKGTFTDANTHQVSHADNPVVTPFNLSATFAKPDSRLQYGLSVYTPFGSTMKWEPGSSGRFETKEISLVSIAFQPTVSYKLTDNFGIGAGFVYAYGHVKIEKDLPLQFSDGSFGDATINAKANSFGINVGAYYKFSDHLSAALSYRSALKMKTSSGTAKFNVPAAVASNFTDQNIHAKLPLPQVFGLGITYKPTDKWTINIEGYQSDWTPYDTIRVHYEETSVAGAMSTDLIRNYKKGYSVRLGGEYIIDSKWQVRAGAIYTKSPIPSGFVNPDVPDANRVNPSFGFSYAASDKLRIDAALLMEFITRKDHNVNSDIDGTYKFNLYLPSIGLSYKL